MVEFGERPMEDRWLWVPVALQLGFFLVVIGKWLFF
jgi:hypothetical protein